MINSLLNKVNAVSKAVLNVCDAIDAHIDYRLNISNDHRVKLTTCLHILEIDSEQIDLVIAKVQRVVLKVADIVAAPVDAVREFVMDRMDIANTHATKVMTIIGIVRFRG